MMERAIPVYKKIQDGLRKKIEAGELKPGDAVSSERELARSFEVSLMTARHALAGLERDGLLERRRGVGTFVAAPKIQFNKLMSFTEQMATRGLRARSRIVSVEVLASATDGVKEVRKKIRKEIGSDGVAEGDWEGGKENPENNWEDGGEDIVSLLALPAGSALVKIKRIRQAENEPFCIETCYLSAKDFPGLKAEQLEKASLFETLEGKYGVRIGHADEEIDAAVADAKTAAQMKLPKGAPLLRIRQVIHSADGKPIIYMLGVYRSDRHTLRIRRFRSGQ